ncbi:MAG: hemerythrin domain-containing protein [Burkholderiaceae bacterium]|jgi:hemerythrin-like domain-containing protein
MQSTITILRSEHVALVTILRAASALLAESRHQQRLPDFTLLRAMLFYVAEFPERHHHRKESALLFPRLRARAPVSRHLLDHLDEDHLRGEARIRELEHILTAFEMLGEPRRAEFAAALARYVDFYAVHMSLEEREVFPLAEQVLVARDWEELDLEMNADPDPLAGIAPQDEYAALFGRLRRHLALQDPAAGA